MLSTLHTYMYALREKVYYYENHPYIHTMNALQTGKIIKHSHIHTRKHYTFLYNACINNLYNHWGLWVL